MQVKSIRSRFAVFPGDQFSQEYMRERGRVISCYPAGYGPGAREECRWVPWEGRLWYLGRTQEERSGERVRWYLHELPSGAVACISRRPGGLYWDSLRVHALEDDDVPEWVRRAAGRALARARPWVWAKW